MKIHTKISEEKYPKESVQKYREALGTFRTQEGCGIFSHQQAELAPLRSWLSSCGVWLPSRRETSREIENTVQKGCEIISQQKGDSATLLQNAFFSLE